MALTPKPVAATLPAQSNVVVVIAIVAAGSTVRRRPIRIRQVYARPVHHRVAAAMVRRRRVAAVRAAEVHHRVPHAAVEDRKRYFKSNKISI